jgi:hypothetical protein
MQYLLRNKISYIIIISLCISSAALAQRDEVFRPNHDDYPYYFGLSVGLANHYFNFNRSARFLPSNLSSQELLSIIEISSINKPHYNAGISASFKIANKIIFKVNPNILLGGDKRFYFNLKKTKDVKQEFIINSSTAQIPIGIKFQSDRYNGFKYTDFMRHYLILGAKIDFDLSNVGNSNGRIPLKEDFISPIPAIYPVAIKNTDWGAELGVGLTFYLRYFNVSPEVKFSYGLRNLKKNDLLVSNIDRISSNFVNFTLHIER